jgi:diguanylate cyclase (GGDEF)-like protein/PAS domain S-box-containing protein
MKEEDGVSQPVPVGSLSACFADSRDGFFLLNECLELCCANEIMQGFIGVNADKVEHFNLHDVMGLGDGQELFLQHCRLAFSGIPTRFEYRVRSVDGSPRWLDISLQRIPETKLLGIARDIDEQKREIESLKRRLNHDELTGLLGRNELLRILQATPAPSPRCEHALLIIELEHFSRINDMCGLETGDKVLLYVSDFIDKLSGSRDVAARIGGKKFALLCRDSSMDAAYAKACEIRDKLIASKFEYNNNNFELGVSIGFTLLQHEHASRAHTALSEADSACHYARNLGHNRIHAYSRSGNNSYRQQESEWISRIATAFENERFQLFYQNIQQIENGREADDHHEILLRMLDENGQHVKPGEFIPAAEKYHLMPLIDRWVIRTLFARNAGLWRAAFALQQEQEDFPMSLCCINISGSSLNDDYFPEFLRDQIALHKVPPQAVCFEITETVAVNDFDKASRLIRELRADGFRFALDDFGKGMSSFAYLQSLPVDFLKIDGSLVQNIDINKIDLCMVEAINRIAQEMGIKTIAEYVKSQRVIDMLQVLGVNYVQGFGIHHPEPLL